MPAGRREGAGRRPGRRIGRGLHLAHVQVSASSGVQPRVSSPLASPNRPLAVVAMDEGRRRARAAGVGLREAPAMLLGCGLRRSAVAACAMGRGEGRDAGRCIVEGRVKNRLSRAHPPHGDYTLMWISSGLPTIRPRADGLICLDLAVQSEGRMRRSFRTARCPFTVRWRRLRCAQAPPARGR